MTPTERARERAEKFRDEVERIYDNWCDVDCRASDLFDRIEKAHAAALADVRREAMEELHDEVVRELMGRAVVKAQFDARESEAWEVAAHHVSKFLRAKIGGE